MGRDRSPDRGRGQDGARGVRGACSPPLETLAAACCLVLCLDLTARIARSQTLDRYALQAVGLFSQACLPFAGDAEGLRRFAATFHLPEATADQRSPFSPEQPAIVFGASTADGRIALVSQDDGACRVVMMGDDPASVRETLLATLAKRHLEVTTEPVRSDAPRAAFQTLYRAAGSERAWKISVTAHTHADDPMQPPEIVLLATPSPPTTPTRSDR